MDALLLVLCSGAALLAAYFTLGRWLSTRVFQLDNSRQTPAVTERDDRDFCPTRKSIIFGHHFTSIAGTGPIVGPAIAVMWGWLPAIIWVVLGAIFVGAVHDLGSIVVSLRNKGRSIGDVAGDLLGPRARLVFLAILIIGLWIVLAVFGLVIAAVLRQYPAAIFPVLVQIPLAVIIGATVHRRGGAIFWPSIMALAFMYASVIWGDWGPLGAFNAALAAQPLWLWTIGLLAYAYVASVLPVWVLLQPRDYINALQLISSLGLIVVGLVVAATVGGAANAAPGPDQTIAERPTLEIVAPLINWQPEGAPPLLPVLFITIACGACSGFHCLVGSGTTSKQISNERDARAVGYGSMLTEGFLATLVIAACAAGIGMGLQWKGSSVIRDTNGMYYRAGRSLQMSADATQYQTKTADLFLYGPSLERPVSAVRVRGAPPKKADESEPMGVVGALNYHMGGMITLPNGSVSLAPLDAAPPLDRSDARLWNIKERTPVIHGRLAFNKQYESWAAAGSLGAKVGAFVEGAANFVASLAIPLNIAIALMAVMVASFAATTMDTACRLQRYVIQELSQTFLPRVGKLACTTCGYDLHGLDDDPHTKTNDLQTCPECGHPNDPAQTTPRNNPASLAAASPLNPFKYLATTHGATLFAVITALALAFIPAPGTAWSLANAGKGGLILWPLFGATNQLLAGFAFVVITAWLIATKRPWAFAVLPGVFMLAVPASAMTWQAFIGNESNPSWLTQQNWLLVTVAGVTLILEAWLLIEVVIRWRTRGPGITLT